MPVDSMRKNYEGETLASLVLLIDFFRSYSVKTLGRSVRVLRTTSSTVESMWYECASLFCAAIASLPSMPSTQKKHCGKVSVAGLPDKARDSSSSFHLPVFSMLWLGLKNDTKASRCPLQGYRKCILYYFSKNGLRRHLRGVLLLQLHPHHEMLELSRLILMDQKYDRNFSQNF